MKPITRGRWAAGVCYYRWKRRTEWLFGRKKYARERQSGKLPHVHFRHRTILLRPLKAFQLHVYVTESHLVGEWRSDMPPTRTYEIVEKEHAIQPAIWGGYERSNHLYRNVCTLDGEWLYEEWVTQNRARMMYEPLLTEGAGG